MTARARLLRLASAVAVSTTTACGGGAARQAIRMDTPEPATAPVAAAPAGRVVDLKREPEGLVWDAATDTIVVAVREPAALVLVDPRTGAERSRVPLPGPARHLALAAPGGPVLVPDESTDRLYRVGLPDGTLRSTDPVGRQPHDAAAAAGGHTFVGDELAHTVHVLGPEGSVRVVPAPIQPGGVSASTDGSVVAVVGVRGRRIAAYTAQGDRIGDTSSGVGPTHVRSGGPDTFFVADTQGDAILAFRVSGGGIRQVGRTPTGPGAPYGLAVDVTRRKLYVTLTASNTLQSYRIDGVRLTLDRSWPTVRQPNDVAVDPRGDAVAVAGTASGELQLIDVG